MLLQEAHALAVNNAELGQWHGATPGLPVVYVAAAETQASSVLVMPADGIKLPKAWSHLGVWDRRCCICVGLIDAAKAG